jgi:cytosine/adenosine deaminase-related metal-dependent hydrolase
MLTRLLTTSGQQYELLDWLYEVTFPMEARFGDVNFARRAYELIVKRIINSGVPQCPSPLQNFQVSDLDGCHRQLRAVTTGRYISKPPRYLRRSSTVTVNSFNSGIFVSVGLSSHLGQRAFVGVRDTCGEPHTSEVSLSNFPWNFLEM